MSEQNLITASSVTTTNWPGKSTTIKVNWALKSISLVPTNTPILPPDDEVQTVTLIPKRITRLSSAITGRPDVCRIGLEDGGVFDRHDVIQVEQELMLVLSDSDYGVAGWSTVQRGFAGTQIADHAKGLPVFRVSALIQDEELND